MQSKTGIVCLSSRIAVKADWGDETTSSADRAQLVKLLQDMGWSHFAIGKPCSDRL
jgi:hypothetical protein